MAGAPQQQQNPDNSLAILWGTLLVFALAGIFWFFFHDQITACALRVRLIEVRLLAWFFPWMKIWSAQLESFSPQQLSFSDLATISTLIGQYLRFPVSVILLSFAVLIYLSRATLQFKRHYDMSTLAKLEKKNWPQITPVVGLDLVSQPIDTAPWAMALTPFEFAQRHKLVELECFERSQADGGLTNNVHDWQVKIKREAAHRVFSIQLGNTWRGFTVLSMPAKAIFAICAARAARDRVAADQLLEQIARSGTEHVDKNGKKNTPTLNFLGTDTLLKKYQNHPLVQETIKKHKYVLGVLASMLVLARRDGVFASAEFLWLKPCDRVLWFVLNCIGRKTAYVEVAGPFAHWMAECAVGRKLSVPMVDTAVDALEIALSEVRLLNETDKKSR